MEGRRDWDRESPLPPTMGAARLAVWVLACLQALHLLQGEEGEVASVSESLLIFVSSSLPESQSDHPAGQDWGWRRPAYLRGPAPAQSHPHVEEIQQRQGWDQDPNSRHSPGDQWQEDLRDTRARGPGLRPSHQEPHCEGRRGLHLRAQHTEDHQKFPRAESAERQTPRSRGVQWPHGESKGGPDGHKEFNWRVELLHRETNQPRLHGLLLRQECLLLLFGLLRHQEHPGGEHREQSVPVRGRLSQHRELHGRREGPHALLPGPGDTPGLLRPVQGRVHRPAGQHQVSVQLLRLHGPHPCLHRCGRR